MITKKNNIAPLCFSSAVVALCQNILLKAMATIIWGQDEREGDSLLAVAFSCLRESDAVDGRHAVLLSALLSIYRCLRALSCVHACPSQNMKLLPSCLCVVVEGTVECRCKDSLYFHFANNSLYPFNIVITLQISLPQGNGD